MRDSRNKFFDAVEELAEPPSGGVVEQWLWGAIIAGMVVAYGWYVLEQKEAWFLHTRFRAFGMGHGFFRLYKGPPAIALGWMYIAIGLVLHFHSFWGAHPRLSRYHQPLKILALIGLILCQGRWVFEMLKLK